MKLIKHMAHQIECELEACECYAKDALEHKIFRPQLAETYYQLANAEYEHVQKLHDWVENIIREAEQSGINPPQSMRDEWQRKHNCIVEEMAEIKIYLNMYR